MGTSLRLYTWVDIERHLRRAAESGDWPDELIEVHAWWDSVQLTTTADGASRVLGWLREEYGPLLEGGSSWSLRLETGERLPMEFEAQELTDLPTRRPKLRPNRITRQLKTPLPHPEEALTGPPVAAFHSFKGGVGRTLHSIAVTEQLSKRGPVLLVDGDLEAPGISWTLDERLPDPAVSYADLLALVHGSTEEEVDSRLDLLADRLQNQRLGNIFVLPSSRGPHRPGDVLITPADIAATGKDPYRLTAVLSRLGSRLGTLASIIDLRAGYSELSAGLLLDPRVHRVFVSSLSYQSVAGSIQLLESISRDAPTTRDSDPVPAAILSLVPEGVPSSTAEEQLTEALSGFVTESNSDEALPTLVVSELRPDWVVLPREWDSLIETLHAGGADKLIAPIADWLDTSEVPSVSTLTAPSDDIQTVRKRLADVTEKLVYAETSLSTTSTVDFMPTAALDRLASDHRTELPTTVVVGAKGAGKTFTFLNLALASTWKRFAEATRTAGSDSAIDARIVPALGPKTGDHTVHARLLEARKRASADPDAAPSSLSLHELIEGALQNPPTGPGGWRRFWLAVLLRSVGVDASVETAEDELASLARDADRLIFVVDGLEEAFLAFSTDENQQAAIRALIQDVPAWLHLVEGRPFGLVVFAREDIVRAVLPQNSGQLIQQHRAYALRWGDDEVIRLAIWIAARANSLPGWTPDQVPGASPEAIEEASSRLWGRKMGSARSREARSTPWVLAALSDFRPQIQARDLVNLVFHSAVLSQPDASEDRILLPSAMRAALDEVSGEKIRAIAEEDPRLNEVFTRLRDQPAEKKKAPFDPVGLGLSASDIALLESTGAAMRIDDQYWFPEIFRHGLGFQNAVSRPRVIQLANRARR